MTQNDIDAMNKAIGYEEGKIYWHDGFNWTSKLWERLSDLGWVMHTSPAGYVGIRDLTGAEVCCGLGRANALRILATIMR